MQNNEFLELRALFVYVGYQLDIVGDNQYRLTGIERNYDSGIITLEDAKRFFENERDKRVNGNLQKLAELSEEMLKQEQYK